MYCEKGRAWKQGRVSTRTVRVKHLCIAETKFAKSNVHVVASAIAIGECTACAYANTCVCVCAYSCVTRERLVRAVKLLMSGTVHALLMRVL